MDLANNRRYADRVRRLSAILVFLVAASLGALGQGSATSQPGVVYVSAAPSGSCAAGSLIRKLITGTGAAYGCGNISGGTGTWAVLGGSGSGTVNSGTANQVALYAGTGTAVSGDANLTDNGTTLAYLGTGGITSSGPVTAGASGSNPGVIVLPGNTATLAVTANTAGWEAPNSATFTAYWLQLPTTGPTSAAPVLQCGTPSSGISACSFGASPTVFPITVSGTVTSGGIPYFNSTTQESSSAILNTNILVKGGGAGGAPTNSLVTDNGTTATYAGTGGVLAPIFTANGTTAGFTDFPQGSTSAAVAPCNTANSICYQAPTSVTAQLRVLASAPATGFELFTNSSGTMTETISATSGTLTSGVGTWGNSAINTVLASTVANVAGHFTNLQVVTALFGTCTTAPIFNVFDGTTNTGSTVTATGSTQTKGTGTSTAQTLTFAAGDIIGIYISSAGGTCTADLYTVTAQYSVP